MENGWLTLEGEVDHEFQGRAEERAIRNIPGVQGITNLIVIKPHIDPKGVEAEIE